MGLPTVCIAGPSFATDFTLQRAEFPLEHCYALSSTLVIPIFKYAFLYKDTISKINIAHIHGTYYHSALWRPKPTAAASSRYKWSPVPTASTPPGSFLPGSTVRLIISTKVVFHGEVPKDPYSKRRLIRLTLIMTWCPVNNKGPPEFSEHPHSLKDVCRQCQYVFCYSATQLSSRTLQNREEEASHLTCW